MIKLKKDTDNIVTLIFDMNQREHNVINHHITEAFVPVIEHLQREKAQGILKGVIITSAKSTFLSGGDLGYLYNENNAEKLFLAAEQLSQFFRDLERPGVPVVAAISGNALGAGFEVALACHHRIVINDPKVRVGIPEVNLGLIPSGGSIIRLMWLLGIEQAFPVLTSGRHYSPQEALKVGIIDDLAVSQKEMMEKAKHWLLDNQNGRRPWDTSDAAIPGGTAHEPYVAERLRYIGARLSAETYNNSPAKRAILNVMTEGSKVDFATACRIENRRFAKLACSATAKNMISTFWFDYHAIKKGLNRPKGYGKFRPRKVGIIGSGQMGSGIALACIQRGLSVVLKDVSKVVAQRGRDYVSQRLSELIAEGTFQESEREEIMGRIVTTENAKDFSDCDLVIEAVFENEQVKRKVTKEAEEQIDEFTIVATNTISIPIHQLAKGSLRPENYVGLHFFPPAEDVPLVEIVRGEATSEETIARAIDFANYVLKIPIVVKDDWGFFAARVQNTYILEGITMLQEGYPPALIENVGRQIGMPRGPLELADELGLELVLNYERQAADHYGSKYVQHPAVSVLTKMIDELQRIGKVKNAGFYNHQTKGKQLWSGLADQWPVQQHTYEREAIVERLLFCQVIESLWCMHEEVVTSTAEANLGSVYGWGFPKELGGVIRFIHSFEKDSFIKRAKEYQDQLGQRFKIPSILKKLATGPMGQSAKAAVE